MYWVTPNGVVDETRRDVFLVAVVPAWFAWRRRERETAGRTLAHESA